MPIQPLSSMPMPGISGVAPIRPQSAALNYRQAADQAETAAASVQTKHRPEVDEPALYGPDALLRGGGPQVENEAADERMQALLTKRDAETRQRAQAQGEAVDGREAYIYQTGPDGQQYAIGRAVQMVRRDEETDRAALPGADGSRLSQGEQDQARRLEDRDAKVRAHEAAHLNAAGSQAAGLPSYTYQTGPDGRAYAVGGSVNISISQTGDPEHDARQADTAQRAALAAGDASAADLNTAQQASGMAARARQRGLSQYQTEAQAAPLTDLFI